MTLVSKSFSEIVTFSRSSNATRVGPTGRVEYAPHNLLQRSQEFDNAYWTKYDATVSINAVSGPDGTVTADKFIEANGAGIFPQSYVIPVLSNATVYTLSIYAKAAERNWIIVNLNDGLSSYRTWFNVSSGVIGTNAAGNTATVTSVGNGWYRCTVSRITSASSGANALIGFQVSNADGVQAYTGDGTSGIYIWGAQLSVGPYALDYTPTTTAAVYGPRFDYDPVTLAARGLLVEEQRVNNITYSEDLTNVAWEKSIAGDTVTANAGVAPDGTTTADKFIADSTNTGAHRVYQAISTGGVYTASLYAKASGHQSLVVTSTSNNWVYFDLTNGTITAIGNGWSAATITPVGNGWYRCSATTSNSNGAYYFGSFNGVGTNGNAAPAFSGNGTDGILMWGAQVEAGSFATSYIPTLASTVTRSADVASVNTLSPWFNATEGTLFAEFDFIGLNPASPGINQGVACFTDGTAASNNLGLLGYGDGSASRSGFVFSGSSQVAFLGGSASSVNTTYKSALATKANDFRLVNSGGSVISDTSGAMSTGINQLLLGNLYTTTNLTYQNGHLRRIAYYPRVLTTAELQALTS